MTGEHRDVVAVGASTGGVEALRALVAGLPPDYPGTLLVVLHVPRDAPSALPRILTRSGPLPTLSASDGEPMVPGHALSRRMAATRPARGSGARFLAMAEDASAAGATLRELIGRLGSPASSAAKPA
ncbi:putative methyltransferase CheB without response regulator receiver domain [Actinoplanes missouriensis 431]|uniref:protein-glutamate methylesterase n=1 Tax=Actinoplanes missouriensis (strain ATCC 14538 / DSM 43046 / CBS 188.64 / JCM 3121 / NBRC 102363 / NCIMB 12654 / NRRL B-3342 / UNCC 431) TaxID=512565 RepID=I0HCA4_ACTM4|nr:chemotaxis protein CheB [Actinoplanes missouriensis]BAL90641.1 putative methyltransferase CheB without response regulator receiver domain [Actinoplanes missouriensis 431]